MIEELSVPAEAPALALFLLKLDSDDVYFGCAPITEADIPSLDPGAVVVDIAPDNPPGCYRWMRDSGYLAPLEKSQQRTEPGVPTIEQAFYDFLTIGPDAARVMAWREWYAKTVDAALAGVAK